MMSTTHKVTFTFVVDDCEGSPQTTVREILAGVSARFWPAIVQAAAHEVDAVDGGPLMWDTTDTDYNWEVA